MLLLLTVLVGLALVAAGQPRGAAPASAVIVSGELDWTHVSVCEWPPGTFLQYHVEGCDGEIFVAWDGAPADDRYDGVMISATGQIVQNGSCQILVAEQVRLCRSDPD
jgi:hypothetical protein